MLKFFLLLDENCLKDYQTHSLFIFSMNYSEFKTLWIFSHSAERYCEKPAYRSSLVKHEVQNKLNCDCSHYLQLL